MRRVSDPVRSIVELFDVSGKTALVTGGGRGIGLMIAHPTTGLLPALRAAADADDPARVINIGSIDVSAFPSPRTVMAAALNHPF